MGATSLVAQGNPADVGPNQAQLVQLDVSSYRIIRLSAGNWTGSPTPVIIGISHVDQPNTPNANLTTSLDSFTLAPDEWVSKVYEVPGEVVVLLAEPDPPEVGGVKVDFTVYGWTD